MIALLKLIVGITRHPFANIINPGSLSTETNKYTYNKYTILIFVLNLYVKGYIGGRGLKKWVKGKETHRNWKAH